jgi:hypothetical protein
LLGGSLSRFLSSGQLGSYLGSGQFGSSGSFGGLLGGSLSRFLSSGQLGSYLGSGQFGSSGSFGGFLCSGQLGCSGSGSLGCDCFGCGRFGTYRLIGCCISRSRRRRQRHHGGWCLGQSRAQGQFAGLVGGRHFQHGGKRSCRIRRGGSNHRTVQQNFDHLARRRLTSDHRLAFGRYANHVELRGGIGGLVLRFWVGHCFGCRLRCHGHRLGNRPDNTLRLLYRLHLPPDHQANDPGHNGSDHQFDRVLHVSNAFRTPHTCRRTLSYEFGLV